MIIQVHGITHRLFFDYGFEIGRREKDDREVTTCILQIKEGVDDAGKGIWKEVALGTARRNPIDLASKRQGRQHAFAHMMSNLLGMHGLARYGRPELAMYDKAARKSIAEQFLAAQPKRPSYQQLKAENKALKAALDRKLEETAATV